MLKWGVRGQKGHLGRWEKHEELSELQKKTNEFCFNSNTKYKYECVAKF